MSDIETFSALIANIYDTTLDAALWPDVLEKVCGFVGGCGTNLFSQDTLFQVAQVHYSWGDNPNYTRLYFEKYIRMNPFFPSTRQSEIISYDEFHETRFFREWAAPQGYVDCLFSLLDKSASGCAMISIRRSASDGLVDDEACSRMQLVVPHLQRAILISRALEHKQAETAKLNDVLDRLSAGIFLLGPRRNITYFNRAGDAMLARGDLLETRKGALFAHNRADDDQLSSALAAAERGDDLSGNEGVALALTTMAGEQYVAHVLPLSSGLRREIADAYHAVAALFVRKASVGWASPAEIIAKLYELTPSEIRVLLAVVEKAGARQIAASLGLTEQTVRTHLKHIFQKTGKKRQADLVKLLADFALSNP